MKDWKSILEQASLLFEQKRFVESALKYEEVLLLKPDMPDVYNKLGIIYSFTNQYDKALSAFERAVEINPEYIEARVNLSLTLNSLGKYDEAAKHLSEAIKLERDKGDYYAVKTRIANLHKETGLLYREIKDNKNAAEEFEKALNLMPHFVDIRLLLTETFIDMEEYDKAEEILIESINIKPAFVGNYIMYGQLYYKKGNINKAREMWKKALELDPNNNTAKVYLKQLEKGE